MSDFAVSWSQLYNDSEKMENLSDYLQRTKEKVSSVQSGLFSCISPGCRYDLQKRLNGIMESLSRESSYSRTFGNSLEKIVRRYLNAEQNICENAGVDFTGQQLLDRMSDSDLEDWSDDIWKLVWKVFGNIGIVGTLISGAGTFWSDGLNAKNIISGLKDVVKIGGSVAEELYKDRPDWSKALFGDWKIGGAISSLADKGYSVASKSDIFLSSLKAEGARYSFTSAETVGEKIKVGTKWAGVALSAIGNAFGNYDEFNGDLSNARFWEETVMETAVDIGIGALATAGATVVLGASAPAVAVGVAAVGVVWLADCGVKWLTKTVSGEERGLTEVISDTILDKGEAVADWASGWWNRIFRSNNNRNGAGGGGGGRAW